MAAGNRTALLLKLAVAATLIGLLVQYASPSNIALAIRSANLWLVLAVVPMILLSMWLAAAQLKFLTDCHGMNLSLMRIIGINASIEFYNLFLPGFIAGGVIRWYRLSKENRMRAQAFAVIAMSRLLNLVSLIGLGILGWLIEDTSAAPPFAIALLAVSLLALAGGLFALSNQQFANGARRESIDDGKARTFVKDKLLKLMDAVTEYRQIPASGRMQLGFLAVSWQLVMILSTYMFCLALSISVSLSALAWIRAVVTLALLVPVTISGFGLREGCWVYFLGLYGVAPAEAFVLSLLTFGRSLFQAVIGCGLEIRAHFHTGNT
jgi:glycosyltransferase 2 family protein